MILNDNEGLAEGLNDFYGHKKCVYKGCGTFIIGTDSELHLTIRLSSDEDKDDCPAVFKRSRHWESRHPACSCRWSRLDACSPSVPSRLK